MLFFLLFFNFRIQASFLHLVCVLKEMIAELVAHGAVLLVTVVAGQSNHDKVSSGCLVTGRETGRQIPTHHLQR